MTTTNPYFPDFDYLQLAISVSRNYWHTKSNSLASKLNSAHSFSNSPNLEAHLSNFPNFRFPTQKTLIFHSGSAPNLPVHCNSAPWFAKGVCCVCEMKIEELEAEGDCDRNDGLSGRQIVGVDDAKRALVGAGARILFYPTLLYNVLRNKMEAEFRWWDEVDQFVLLGAVPFPKDVPLLKRLGVGGVITLNEPYETLVPTSLYRAHGIDHLVIPTRDYLFAPSFVDIDRAVEFIHKNASCGEITYVHCKAGRGRSTTIVLCYLVKYKNMTPSAALDYVRSRRPRVLLAPSQWKAVQEYSRCGSTTAACSPSGDAVLITKDDLEGYHGTYDDTAHKQLAIVPKMVKVSPMIARLSCLFASLKVSGNCGPVTRRLSAPEPRAC